MMTSMTPANESMKQVKLYIEREEIRNVISTVIEDSGLFDSDLYSLRFDETEK